VTSFYARYSEISFKSKTGDGMLTVFSTPKAFVGHIGVIQRNAIMSWTMLRPRPEIILLGNEDGAAQVAQEFGLRHIPEIACNPQGTPLMSDVFRQAERIAGSALLCYVNADILLLGVFAEAVAQVSKKAGKFLIVSRRINLDITEAMSFEADWEDSLKKSGHENGTPGGHTAIDIFAFPKGTYPHVPDFGIGRLWFDQWLIKAARLSYVPVVDVSLTAPVFHQNHDYSHVSGGEERVWRGVEAQHNFRLYGGMQHAYTLLDVTHELTGSGEIRRVRLRKPLFALKHNVWNALMQRTLAVRNTLRLRRKFWRTGKSVPDPR
jgi:hypothetical protein